MIKYFLFALISINAFALEGKAGIEAENAKVKAKFDKLRAIDWDKVQSVDDLKKIVKQLTKQIVLNEDE